MVIRRSHFVSICLLALASSIALTEYITYSPIISDSSEDGSGLFFDTDSKSIQNNDDSDDIVVRGIEGIESDVDSKDDSASVVDGNPGATNIETPSVLESIPQIANKDVKETLVIRSGDTITSVLTGVGFSKTDVHMAAKALSKIFNIRNLKIGQEVLVEGNRESGELVLNSFEIKPEPRYRIVVSRTSDGKFKSEKIEVPIKKVVKTASGAMSPRDPVATMVACGVKNTIAKEALKTLGQVVNLRSSREPVSFEFLYQDFYDPDGNVAMKPELLYASALVRGKIFRIYKFKNAKDHAEYINSDGVTLSSMIKSRSMLARPLSSMKITSGYGVRVHPVRGGYRRHTGVDLKASVGAPIYAAADGKVMKACYYSGYGKYIKIEHSGAVDTAYGHLSRMVVRPGQWVRQGQVIGYVGVTGITTGPHLHYEVLKGGKFVNPMFVVKQDPQKLTGKALAKFNQFKKEINLQVAGLTPSENKKILKVKRYS